jgi:DNA-binding transcriptional regulator YhcF (GntR family)
MPRPRSAKVSELKVNLLTRIRQGYFRPGDRFLSNRALTERFGVSYQTAHRLISELCEEGWLERRAASGTYIAGKKQTLTGVQLLFNARAQRTGSFGAQLLDRLKTRLERDNVECLVGFVRTKPVLRDDLFPVIWECKDVVVPDLGAGRYALLLHDLAPPGIAGAFIDAVATDDFSGGVCAAEVLRDRGHGSASVLAGPAGDVRSVRRVDGFRSVLPKGPTLWADGWFKEHGMAIVPRLLKNNPSAVFCCNDRLAEAVMQCCNDAGREPPYLIGFDNAPVAESMNTSTIAIPWDEMIEAAASVVRRRLRGDASTSTCHILAPRPIIRR